MLGGMVLIDLDQCERKGFIDIYGEQRCHMPETVAFCQALQRLSEDTRELAAEVDDAVVSPQLIEIADEILELARVNRPTHVIDTLTSH
jgi:hypothetical protein